MDHKTMSMHASAIFDVGDGHVAELSPVVARERYTRNINKICGVISGGKNYKRHSPETRLCQALPLKTETANTGCVYS